VVPPKVNSLVRARTAVVGEPSSVATIALVRREAASGRGAPSWWLAGWSWWLLLNDGDFTWKTGPAKNAIRGGGQ